MEEKNQNFIAQLEAEYDEIATKSLMTDEQIRKKVYAWFFRTIVAIILIVIFWKYQWVRILCLIWIPFSIVSLVMIFAYNHLLNRKLQKTAAAIEHLKATLKEEETSEDKEE